MPYELIKRIVVDYRPSSCKYCNHGWANYGGEKVLSCTDTCEIYKAFKKGKLVVPEGFDEVREVKSESSKRQK